MQLLRGYWADLPAESTNRGRYAPPDEPDVRQWLGVLAIVVGIWVATTGSVGMGLLIALGGLLWGAWMAAQVQRYRVALEVYNVSLICLAQYHTFVP
ncbi:hypothetical protein GCM10010317_077480 [Streptomyces mirabilis]|uniref:hypothetical protein n=1 Tax=Streptomyces mirabilis TaxID=68239 RepID=UPI00167DE084|nr:hypothetical protein [Streptomyces mirabilis]GHD70345.1 hypothetical protein GCM10010317_077480 [Streptomyces mirabilis]